ncbi:MAG TPA: (d)CMP kinase [Nocardioidaceae bacterium]|nr:(d)CMP kinase [Nocardioidaceae bacterium]
MQSEGQAGAGLVVAVDGPSSSGKSSTARGVAERLRLRYLDTGAMYRALTWWMLEQGVDVHDAEAVARTCGEPTLVSGTDPGAPTIQVDGTDVSGPIRGPAVTAAVSAVSAVPAVRDRMVGLQRQIIGAGRIVVEGRDIGSVVAPGAQLKVFLTADPDTRAHRRTAELVGGNASVHDTAADLDRRDRLDSVRAASPLVRAEDALVLDTTHLSLAEAVDAVAELARLALGEAQWEQPR